MSLVLALLQQAGQVRRDRREMTLSPNLPRALMREGGSGGVTFRQPPYNPERLRTNVLARQGERRASC